MRGATLIVTAFVATTVLGMTNIASPQRTMAQQQMDYFVRYDSQIDFDRFQVDQPVIGIMSMPIWSESLRSETFPWDHFTWEMNVNFVHYGGSHSVPIKYDLPDEELYELLGQINGAMFTGGDLLIIAQNGTQHEYYKTAKKIFQYSKDQFDKGINWPIIGICQGLQVLHWIVNDDIYETLSTVHLHSVSRPL